MKARVKATGEIVEVYSCGERYLECSNMNKSWWEEELDFEVKDISICMETKFNFKSQICTSREQSERLLALGLKKETADMWYPHFAKTCPIPLVDETLASDDIPAWSLHRLCDMMPKNIAIDGDTAYPLQIQKRSDGKWCVGYQGWYDCVGDLYDSVIRIYQQLISEGYLDEFCNKG